MCTARPLKTRCPDSCDPNNPDQASFASVCRRWPSGPRDQKEHSPYPHAPHMDKFCASRDQIQTRCMRCTRLVAGSRYIPNFLNSEYSGRSGFSNVPCGNYIKGPVPSTISLPPFYGHAGCETNASMLGHKEHHPVACYLPPHVCSQHLRDHG